MKAMGFNNMFRFPSLFFACFALCVGFDAIAEQQSMTRVSRKGAKHTKIFRMV